MQPNWTERDHGPKQQQRADNEDRSIIYRQWRRGIGGSFYVIDLDQVEFTIRDDKLVPYAVIEITKADQALVEGAYLAAALERMTIRDVQGWAVCQLAEMLNVKAWFVVFNKDCSRFWVYNLTDEVAWVEMNEIQYIDWLRGLRAI